MSLKWQEENADYYRGFEVISHAKLYLVRSGRLDVAPEGIFIQAHRDIVDAWNAQTARETAMRYLDSTPIEPNEHNLHLAARIVAAAAILLGIGWVAYLFWMRV